jgi:hypothetical protein
VIGRESLINRLEDLGLRCTNPGQLIGLFKGRVDGIERLATVNLQHDLIDERTVRQTLIRVGCDLDDIENFIATHRAC